MDNTIILSGILLVFIVFFIHKKST